MNIRQDDPTAPHVAALRAHHLRELHAAPEVTFWTAWRDGRLLGFGALKELDSSHGEVKSMRPAPAARGTGADRALLDHIIAEARRRGYWQLSLEIGTAAPHGPAIALFRSAGFTPSDPFAAYRPSPHNQFFRRDLSS